MARQSIEGIVELGSTCGAEVDQLGYNTLASASKSPLGNNSGSTSCFSSEGCVLSFFTELTACFAYLDCLLLFRYFDG